jgi:hypothetical protein
MAVVVREESACDCACDWGVVAVSAACRGCEDETRGVRALSERWIDMWLLEVGRAAIVGFLEGYPYVAHDTILRRKEGRSSTTEEALIEGPL